ncbi:MAG TPA: hypothetical protein VNY76_05490 [Candidatus Acidoferrales bacterium]|nr:hypothetical protein [Candidatus Acidoferrales bacterium]
MAGIKRGNRIRRALGVAVLAGSLAIGVTTILTSMRASAGVEIPNKSCTGPASDGIPEPGDVITCTVSALGGVVGGESFIIAPTAPTGSTVTGCTGVSMTTPFVYSTVAVPTSTSCTITVTAVTPVIGNPVLATETVQIPGGTAAGTSVAQSASFCDPGFGCSPAAPMGVSGPGSCVDGTALPAPAGGCMPAAPSSSPPTSPPTSGCLPTPLNSFCIPPSTPTPPPPTCLPAPFNSFCIPPGTPPSSTCLPTPLNTFCIPPGSNCVPIPGVPPPLGCPATSSPGTNSPGGNNPGGNNPGGGNGGNGTGQSQAGQVAGTTATSTPFTGGPPHPLPILGFTIVGLGLLISGFTFWPGARRRLRLRLERTKNNW